MGWVLQQPYVRSDGAHGRGIDAFDNGLAGVGVLTTILEQAGCQGHSTSLQRPPAVAVERNSLQRLTRPASKLPDEVT